MASPKFITVENESGRFDLAIQQHEVGLYVCVYQNGKMVEQFGTQATEAEFLAEMASITVV